MPWVDGDRLNSTNLNTKMGSGIGYNVTDVTFGAVGDGVTDDTAAIQAAIDAVEAAGGGTVWVPRGRFAFSSLVLSASGAVLAGVGRDASRLVCTDTSGGIVVNMSPSSSLAEFTMRDLGVELGAELTGYLIDLQAIDTFRLDNVLLHHGGSTFAAATATALRVGECNAGVMTKVDVLSTAADPFAVGFDLFKDVTANRGNLTIVGGILHRAMTGIRVGDGADTLVNNIQIYGTKLLHTINPADPTVGVHLTTRAQDVILDGIHSEGYETGVLMDDVENVILRGANISRFESGAQVGVSLTGECDRVDIRLTRLANNNAGGTGISLSAEAHRAIHIGPNDYSNLTTTISDLSTSTTQHSRYEYASGTGPAGSGAARFRYLDDVNCDTFVRLGPNSLLVIASGAVTVTGSRHRLDTQDSDPTDDLDTINVTGTRDHALLVLSANNSARSVVVKNGTGNIVLAGADFTLDNSQDRLTLLWDGNNWFELARSDNGA